MALSNPYPIGQRVRHSVYALRSSLDYWQKQGEYNRKERAKDAYFAKLAERGTVTKILENGYEVAWDSGAVSQLLSGQIDKHDSILFPKQS